jgi:hypothetical protein
MAIKDFIQKESYTKITYLNFSRSNRQLSLALKVYSDSTKTVELLNFNQQLMGMPLENINIVTIFRKITSNNELITMIPDFKLLKIGESLLIDIESPSSDYIRSLNNKIISREKNETLSILNTNVITINGIKYQRGTDGKFFVEMGSDYEYLFDEKFAINKNIEIAAYEYLMSLSMFKNCEAC